MPLISRRCFVNCMSNQNKQIMKTIEEEAMRYAVGLEVSEYEQLSKDQMELHAKLDFKAGVSFAQRWIPVGEELPTFPDQKNIIEVITILDDGNRVYYLICWLTKSGKFFNTTTRLFPSGVYSSLDASCEDVTEFVASWRPIELK